VINRAHGVWCPYCYRTRRDGIDADAARKSGGFLGFLSTFRGLFARRGGVAIDSGGAFGAVTGANPAHHAKCRQPYGCDLRIFAKSPVELSPDD